VIKVENPTGGDFQPGLAANGRAMCQASFLITTATEIGGAQPERAGGARALLKLAATADVFWQNFRPGVIDRMAWARAKLRKVASELVYGVHQKWVLVTPAPSPTAGLRSPDPALSGCHGAGQALERRRPNGQDILPDKLTGVLPARPSPRTLFAASGTGEGQPCPDCPAGRHRRVSVEF